MSAPVDTRARIVDVAAQLLHQYGPAAVTTRRVAQNAGVQAPVIYRHFGDKDGLLDAVAEHVMATHVAAKADIVRTATTENVDPVVDLRAGWDMQIEFGIANPTLFTLLSAPGRGSDSPAAQAGLAVLRDRVHRIAEAGRLRVSEQRAVDLIHAAGTGAVLVLLSTPSEMRDLGLADTLFDAVLRRVLTVSNEPPSGRVIAAAVSFRAVASSLDVLSDAERRLLAEWLDRVIDGLE